MSGGYTPVFRSIFTGTLFGKYPDLPLWLVLLAMADKNGVVDAHPSYISAACGIHQDEVEDCIRRFCEPDSNSRTPDDDGRRLNPIDGRGFGWRIVNHSRYREKARKAAYDADRTESGADAARKRSSRLVPTCPDVSRAVPLSDSDSDTDTKKKPPSVASARKRATPARRCPDGWEPPETELQKMLAECPDVDLLAATRKFRDHEFAKAKSDWLAAWRNWMREEQTRAAKSDRPRPTRYDELRQQGRAAVVPENTPAMLFLTGGKS